MGLLDLLVRNNKRSHFTNEEDLIIENLHYLTGGNFRNEELFEQSIIDLKESKMFNPNVIDNMALHIKKNIFKY